MIDKTELKAALRELFESKEIEIDVRIDNDYDKGNFTIVTVKIDNNIVSQDEGNVYIKLRNND